MHISHWMNLLNQFSTIMEPIPFCWICTLFISNFLLSWCCDDHPYTWISIYFIGVNSQNYCYQCKLKVEIHWPWKFGYYSLNYMVYSSLPDPICFYHPPVLITEKIFRTSLLQWPSSKTCVMLRRNLSSVFSASPLVDHQHLKSLEEQAHLLATSAHGFHLRADRFIGWW